MPLVSVVAVAGLGAGAGLSVAHGLTDGLGTSVAPTLVLPDRATNITVVSVTATMINFQNNGQSQETANFFAERIHSVQAQAAFAGHFWVGGAPSTPGAFNTVNTAAFQWTIAAAASAALQIGTAAFPNMIQIGTTLGGSVNLNGPVRPTGWNALSRRFELRWIAGEDGIPHVNGVGGFGNNLADTIVSSRYFEVVGTSIAGSTQAYSAEGGITFTTAAVAADQVIMQPGQVATTNPWASVTWGTDKETIWETEIDTGPSIVDTILWFGLKLTNTAVVATDINEAFFRYEEGVNGGRWQAIYRINPAAAVATDTGVLAVLSSRYHFKIIIDSARIATFYLNGVLVATSTALNNAIDFIPFCGIEVQGGGAAGAKSFTTYGQAISRVQG